MRNEITVDFDPKTQKLVMNCGFHLVEVMRSFPSRRFDPKSKAWKAPLTKSNITHFKEHESKFDWILTDRAKAALGDFDKLTAGPVYLPFPQDHFQGAKYSPLDHQWPMLDRGWNLRAYALIAAMGTGKTFVTINMAMARFDRGLIDGMVVICPATLRRTWEKEFAKYARPGSYTTRVAATNDPGVIQWLDSDPDKLHVYLISVEGLGVSESYFDAVHAMWLRKKKVFAVCDESSRIKNPAAKRTERAIELGGMSEYRMVLNGTPVAKGIQDLWSQFEFLDPNIIGSGDYWAFKTRYIEMGGYENKQIVGYKKVDELMGLITPHSLEVNKSVLNLPPKLYKQRILKPTTEQIRLFEKIRTGVGEGPMIKVQNVLERTLRLQQVIGGFEPMTNPDTMETTVRPLTQNPKLDDLMEFIDDNYSHAKFVIWARYVPEIELICAALGKKYGPDAAVHYYGLTSAEDRAAAEDRYCNDPTTRFLVGNPSAAGLGLTFISPESDLMYYYSGTFAYIDRMQSEDRGHRIGQTSAVTVVDPILEGTFDEVIAAATAAKKDVDQFVKERIAEGVGFIDLVKGKTQV